MRVEAADGLAMLAVVCTLAGAWGLGGWAAALLVCGVLLFGAAFLEVRRKQQEQQHGRPN